MGRVREGDDMTGMEYAAIVHMHGKGDDSVWGFMYTDRCTRIHIQSCLVTSLRGGVEEDTVED